jgi:hypothetical protein
MPDSGFYTDGPSNTDDGNNPRRRRRSYAETVRLGSLASAERARRYPKPWHVLADELGVPQRTLREYHRRYRECEHEGPAESADREIDSVLADLDAIAETARREVTNGDNSSARVGAAKLLMAVRRERFELLIASGRVLANPKALFDAQAERDRMTQFIGRMSETLEQNDVEPAVLDRMLELLDEICQTPLYVKPK